MSTSKHYGTAMYRVVAALSHRLTPEDVADGVVREAAATMGASACHVFLCDEERDRIRVLATMGYPPSVAERWTSCSMNDFPIVAAVRRGEPMFTSARLSDSRFDATLQQQFGDGAGFAVPLEAGGRVLGGLGMSFDHVRDFSDVEREFIMILAGHCAQALERARLFEQARKASAAAESARRELEAVLHKLPIGVGVTRRDGRIVINDEAHRIFGTDVRGYTVERRDAAYPSRPMRRPDGRAYAIDELPITRAMRGESVVGEELIAPSSDGSHHLVRVNAVPVRNDKGEIEAAVATFCDITQERAILDELNENQRRYRALARATNDVIWVVNPETHQIEWNGALEQQFGHRPEDVKRFPGGGLAWWIDHIHPDERESVRQSFADARDRGDDVWLSEYRMRRADGSYVPTFDRCVFERDESGRVVRIIGAIRDISEQQRLVDELRDAVRVRDDFLSIAGHELRTPLAALSLKLAALRELPLDDEQRMEKVKSAERQIRRITLLADELLEVSRIIHGKLQLQLDDVDLTAVVREAAARLEEDFQRDGTPLVVEASESAMGRWDRLRLDLAVTNLLTNALRYGEKRPVSVRVESDGTRASVVVTDHGVGIRREDQVRIFERFVRAAPSRQLGGLGVGLWLTKQIANAHGASIDVVSEPGQGATFTLTLPQKEALARERLASQAEARRSEVGEILDRITDSLMAFDSDLRLTYLNARAREIAGPLAPELIGRHLTSHDTEGGHAFAEACRTALRSHQPMSVEFDSGLLRRTFRGTVYPSASGVVAIFHDVTEQRRVEAELTQREQRYRQLFAATRDAIMVFAVDGEGIPERVIEVNAAACELYGLDAHTLTRRIQTELQGLPARLGTGRASADLSRGLFGDPAITAADGTRVAVEVTIRPFSLGDERFAFAVLRDIRDRQQIESRLSEAQEAERGRIARELHDEVGQSLSALHMSLETMARDQQRITEPLREAKSIVSDLIEHVRDMSLQLRPAMLDDLGLLPALGWLVERFARQTTIAVDLESNGLARRLPATIETTVYRIVQEALSNVARHAAATRVLIELRDKGERFSLEVVDDGKGFDVTETLRRTRSSGLFGMRQRAALTGGALAIESSTANGTRVVAELPL